TVTPLRLFGHGAWLVTTNPLAVERFRPKTVVKAPGVNPGAKLAELVTPLAGKDGAFNGGTPETRRIRLLSVSARYKAPDASRSIPNAALSEADVAGPPSPANAAAPLPATVDIRPSGVMRRTRWFGPSVKEKAPG